MNYFIMLAAALLPIAILLIYAYRKDPRPEPTSLLAKSFAYGVLICFPIVAVEFGVSHIVNILITDTASLEYVLAEAFLVAAIPEECFKLLALWLILRHNPYFDNTMTASCMPCAWGWDSLHWKTHFMSCPIPTTGTQWQ